MKMLMKTAMAMTVLVGLAACGGGGDDNDGNPVEGFWKGSTSNGANAAVVILENGEAWGIYTQGGQIVGAVNGTASASGSTFSASGLDFSFVENVVYRSTYSGSITPQSRINATSSLGVSVSLGYDGAYNRSANMAELAGSYTVYGRSGGGYTNGAPMTISADGSITVSDQGCTATGRATPRASGKNVFNMTVTFSGACYISNAPVSGVAVVDTTTNPKTILALGLNAAKSDGLIAVAVAR